MDSANTNNRVRKRVPLNTRTLWGTIFLHGLNDMHSTTLPTIIPMLAQSISLTLGQAGFLNALFGLTNIFGQPVFGFIADKIKRPWLAVWGPMLSVAGASLLPLSPNYGIAFIFVGMISCGTALFHPQGTGKCGASCDINRLAFYLAIFQSCGTLGSAIGPLYVVFMISMLGKGGFPLVVIPAVALICAFVWYEIGSRPEDPVEKPKIEQKPHFFENLRYLMSRVGWIISITSGRDAVFQSIKIFLPMLLISRGGTVAEGGIILFAITLAATLAGIVGGKIADKFGDENILFGSLLIAPIFLVTGLRGSELYCIALLMLGFAIIQCSSPITTAMSQKRCPENRSMASSLSNGVSWGIANLCVTPVGVAADIFGLDTTLSAVAFMPWLVVGVSLIIRQYKKRRRR